MSRQARVPHRRSRSLPAGESGAAAVEFALIVLPLMMLLFGIVNFGLAYHQQIQLSGAAREGARTMAITNNSGRARDDAIAAAPTLDDPPPTVSISGPCVPGEPVIVEVTYPFSFLFIGAFIDAPPMTLRGVGVMRCNG